MLSKEQQVTQVMRNKEIMRLYKKGFPRDYILEYFGLTKGALSKIINKGRTTKKTTTKTD